MSSTALTPAPVFDAEVVHDEDRVLVRLKTPLDVGPVEAFLPADLTLERAVTAMRKAVAEDDLDGGRVLDNVNRELSATRVNFLVPSRDGILTNTPRNAVLRDLATPIERRTAKGLKKDVPTVVVEVQAYAGVGGPR